MKAIFYDRNCDLVRCQFAGMNEKGEPNWLIIEQGKPTETLAEVEKNEHCNNHYRLLCLEGEEVDKVTLLRILHSFIGREVEGWGEMPEDICNFKNDMVKHQIEWDKEKTGLRFSIHPNYQHQEKYYLSTYLNTDRCFVGAVSEITDLDWLLELIDDFCCELEDMFHIEKVYRTIDIKGVDKGLFSENLLARFDEVTE